MSSSKKVDIKQVGGFEVTKKLGSGCFGEVYRGVSQENGEEVAIKFEDKSTKAPQLKHEADILNLLKSSGDEPQPLGFTCPYYFFGIEGKWTVLVMPILSKALEDCMQSQSVKGKFSAKTTLMVADQLICRIEYLHSKGIVHRDIKPENFMWGAGKKQNIIHLIDFGLSKRYHDGKNHIPFRRGQSLTGTARYVSVRTHLGFEQGRCDDLEAIGHMLMYFLRGKLPWSGLEAKTKEEKYKKIADKKKNFPLEELCEGYPICFQKYLQITRDMSFAQRPDYVQLRKLFSDEMEKAGYTYDFQFEWYGGKEHDMTPLPPWVTPVQPDDMPETKNSGGSNSCCAVM